MSDKRFDKAYQEKEASELLKAPVNAIKGLKQVDAENLKIAFGIDNIKEMSDLVFYKRAKEIVKLAEVLRHEK